MDDRAQAASDPSPVVFLMVGIIGVNVASTVLSAAQVDALGQTLLWGGGWLLAAAFGGLATQHAVRSDFGDRLGLEGP